MLHPVLLSQVGACGCVWKLVRTDYGVHLCTSQEIYGVHMSIGDRLKEERERIGLSQEKLGAVGGVQKRAQINYEAGVRHPDAAYLSAVAEAGLDVLYILTGQRGQPVPATAALPPRLRALVDNYEHTDAAGREIIEATATAAAQSTGKKAARGGK